MSTWLQIVSLIVLVIHILVILGSVNREKSVPYAGLSMVTVLVLMKILF